MRTRAVPSAPAITLQPPRTEGLKQVLGLIHIGVGNILVIVSCLDNNFCIPVFSWFNKYAHSLYSLALVIKALMLHWLEDRHPSRTPNQSFESSNPRILDLKLSAARNSPKSLCPKATKPKYSFGSRLLVVFRPTRDWRLSEFTTVRSLDAGGWVKGRGLVMSVVRARGF